jgi:hypothetical protein
MSKNAYGLTPEQAARDQEIWNGLLADRAKRSQRAANRAVARRLLVFLTLGASELVPAMRAW